MVIGVLLKGVGGLDDPFFLTRSSDDLKADGEPCGAEAAGDGNGRHTGEIHRDGEDIREVHLERILYLCPKAEGWGRGSRGDDHVALGEGLFKIRLDKCPHL